MLALGKGPCRNGHSHMMSEMASSQKKLKQNGNLKKHNRTRKLNFFFDISKKGDKNSSHLFSPWGQE